MGNWFAYLVLLIWPLVSVRLFMVYSIQVAILITLLGGYMFLPETTMIDLPMLPPLNKGTTSILAAFVGCSFIRNHKVSLLGKSKLKWLLLIYIFSPFITAMNNGEVIVVGETILPANSYYDALSVAISHVIGLVPYAIGRQFFKEAESQQIFFKIMVLAGLFYSLLILIELRVSPQLHTWVYGFFPHQFIQQFRFGGWRPVVFMGHGLKVSMFMAVSFISSLLLMQQRKRIASFSPITVVCYLFVILVLSKSLAPVLYALLVFLVFKLFSIKMQFKFSKIIVLFVLLYPVMSIMDLFPHKEMISQIKNISPERAQSLEYRFLNEHILLQHAKNKLSFGWGLWSRNRVYSEKTGEDITTTDGGWIITLGTFGIVGFIAEFGLLVFPVYRAISVYKLVRTKQEQTLLAVHTLALSFILLDQLPNASLTFWTWLFAGILMGRTEAISRDVSSMKR